MDPRQNPVLSPASGSAVATPPSTVFGAGPDHVPRSLPPPHRSQRRRGSANVPTLFRPRSRTDPRDLKLPVSFEDPFPTPSPPPPPLVLPTMPEQSPRGADDAVSEHFGLSSLRPVDPTSPVDVDHSGATAPYVQLPASSPIPKSAAGMATAGPAGDDSRLSSVATWWKDLLQRPWKRQSVGSASTVSSYKSVNSISDSVSVGAESASEFYKVQRPPNRRRRKGWINTLWTYAHRLHIILTVVVLVFIITLFVNHVPHLLRVVDDVDHTAHRLDDYLDELDKLVAFFKEIEHDLGFDDDDGGSSGGAGALGLSANLQRLCAAMPPQ